MSSACDTPVHLTLRQLRNFLRQPWFVALSLVQPIIWLLLFGALFKKVVEIPGFSDQLATSRSSRPASS